MKILKKTKPRIFKVGFDNKISVKDFGKIYLKNHEQITFMDDNHEYDFGKKDWGYYSTPSINGRLKNNQFQVYLVKNIHGKIYLMTVKKSKIKNFENYCSTDHQKILFRLDNFKNEYEIINTLKNFIKKDIFCKKFNCLKNNQYLIDFYLYNKPPKGEPDYKFKRYKRKVVKCQNCGHFFGIHNLINIKNFYKTSYSSISHGKNVYKKFKKINNLKSNSDNYQRVERFVDFFHKQKNKKLSLLDIGSGICVFLSKLKSKTNWSLTGVEPNIEMANFGKIQLNLNIHHGNFNKNIFKRKKFDIITLNKVAEHIKNPKVFLNLVKRKLTKNGYIYIEVPDGYTASNQANGKSREEFMVDHFHIFSLNSFYNLLNTCGFQIQKIDKIVEKSGKYTLFAFCKKI